MSSHTVLPQDLLAADAEQFSLERADLQVWVSSWLPKYMRRAFGFHISAPDGEGEHGEEKGDSDDESVLQLQFHRLLGQYGDMRAISADS